MLIQSGTKNKLNCEKLNRVKKKRENTEVITLLRHAFQNAILCRLWVH